MLDILKNRLKQGYRTVKFPSDDIKLAERFRGQPVLEPSKCPAGCTKCSDVCPTGALKTGPLSIDLGACLFCPACEQACPSGAIHFSQDYKLATSRREDLVAAGGEAKLAAALDEKLRKLYGRSLKLRQVSAGGCNACEADLNVLGINVFDLGRFGIQWVASPRHADGVVITGPVTANMRSALLETWKALPAPRLVIAVGACAISGGCYAGAPDSMGIPKEMPVDLFIPGCPPHPWTLLDGFLRLMGRIEEKKR